MAKDSRGLKLLPGAAKDPRGKGSRINEPPPNIPPKDPPKVVPTIGPGAPPAKELRVLVSPSRVKDPRALRVWVFLPAVPGWWVGGERW